MLLRPLLILLAFLLLVPPWSATAGETYPEIRADYQLLIKSSQLQRQRSNWEKLIRRFDCFARQNPGHPDAEKALYLQARTWEELSRASGSNKDAREAISHYLALADRYANSNLADDALFAAGQVAENRLADPTSAARYYQWLIEQLPAGDKTVEARARLAVLPPVGPQSSSVGYDEQRPDKPAGSPRLEKIRFWSGPEYTRVVLDLSAPVSVNPHLLKGDLPRLYFDLPDTSLAPDLPTETAISNGLVERVRASRFDDQRSRVVIDLGRPSEYRLVTLENPYRIVVDVQGTPAHQVESGPAPEPADDSIAGILKRVPTTQAALHVPQQARQEGIRVIVIDAGHGGKDPGAIGPNNVMEKTVTLQLAKELAARLGAELGVKVLLTRSDDRFLELRERTAFANRAGADLFISLHANASPSSHAYGLETYFLNLAKNSQAAEVAARENGTSLEDVTNLEAILFDLMANAKINESSRLAAEVQQALVAGLRPHFSHIKDLGVRQGPFHVLLGATMPSVLVEAAFISNSREEKRLKNHNYQKQVAAAIVKGIKNYATTVDQVARR
jgi:N-acetylmuramoyl-L-alanine amidase